jgi:hypothetical protein
MKAEAKKSTLTKIKPQPTSTGKGSKEGCAPLG